MMIKGCIFDLDGTLLNTLGTIAAHANKTLAAHGFSTYETERYRDFIGNGARVLITRALAGKGASPYEKIEELLREYVASYDADPYEHTAPYDGILSLLRTLGELGIKVAILSNKPTSSVRLLTEHFFDFPFTHVWGAPEEPSHLKPSPVYVHRILADWGISASEVLYVGDSTVDMQTAKNAGLAYPYAAAWGFCKRSVLESETALVADAPTEIEAFVRARAKELS